MWRTTWFGVFKLSRKYHRWVGRGRFQLSGFSIDGKINIRGDIIQRTSRAHFAFCTLSGAESAKVRVVFDYPFFSLPTCILHFSGRSSYCVLRELSYSFYITL